jgi:hypothetical protein
MRLKKKTLAHHEAVKRHSPRVSGHVRYLPNIIGAPFSRSSSCSLQKDYIGMIGYEVLHLARISLAQT